MSDTRDLVAAGSSRRLLLRGSVALVLAFAAFLTWWLVTRPVTTGEESFKQRWREVAGDQPLEELNVVLVTIDTLRADHLASYGYSDIETPNIDALAREGVRFASATSTVPFTLPAHSSIMTGTYPPYHGVRENVGYHLGDKIPTLAELLRAQGLATAGFVSAFVLDSRWGIARGFDHYFDDFDLANMESANLGSVQRDGAETVAEAVAWLDSESNEPFFLWVHLFEPHDPYTPPEPYRSRYLNRPYDGEVAYADALVGELIAGLRSRRLLDKSLLMLTGDHGEGLGDHREAFHGFFVYDSTIHVPLIIRVPFGGFGGRVVRAPVSHVDLLPTILEATGRAVPAVAQGESLVPLILDPTNGDDRGVFSESTYPLYHYGWAPLRSLRTNRYKLIDAPRAELYDLETDPGEEHNLIDQEPVTAAALHATLADLAGGIEYSGDKRASAVDMDDETLLMLRSLGYVAGGGQAGLDDEIDGQRADPKDKIELHRLIMLAQSDIGAGRDEAAEEKLLRLLDEDPAIVDAQQILGNIYNARGDYERGVPFFKAALELNDEHKSSLFGLADAYRGLGRPEEALLGYQRLLELNPHESKAVLAIAQIHVGRGEMEEALAVLERAAGQEDPPAILFNQIGELLVLQNRSDEAITNFRRAIERNDWLAQPRFNLAILYEERGDREGAIGLYEEAIEMAPKHYQAQFNLGRLYGELGERYRQMELYEAAIESNPNFIRGYFYLGMLLLSEGENLERAESLTRQGLELDPEHTAGPLGYYLLADILNRKGERAAARTALRKAREIEGSTRQR